MPNWIFKGKTSQPPAVRFCFFHYTRFLAKINGFSSFFPFTVDFLSQKVYNYINYLIGEGDCIVKLLEERILRDGEFLPGNVLKVDSFLNHQIDVPFICELGREFERLFHDSGVTKILTIEASGIGVACLTAQYFGVPVVFAKKSKTSNIAGDMYTATVESYTHGTVSQILVSKKYLSPDDRVLIIDDFLANGQALNGLISVVEQAGAAVVGAGIVIEKAFQVGGDLIRQRGIRVESLARVAKMDGDTIEFVD